MVCEISNLLDSRMSFNSFCKSLSEPVKVPFILRYTPVSDILTILASTELPTSMFSVSFKKLDSINCLIPSEILSLSESIEITTKSISSPFLYDLMKSSGLPRLVISEM